MSQTSGKRGPSGSSVASENIDEPSYQVKKCLGINVPQPSTLVSIIKLSSLLTFAGAARFMLLGIDVSDNNLMMKIKQNEITFTILFLGCGVVLVG
jgi:hypothetical protein